MKIGHNTNTKRDMRIKKPSRKGEPYKRILYEWLVLFCGSFIFFSCADSRSHPYSLHNATIRPSPVRPMTQ